MLSDPFHEQQQREMRDEQYQYDTEYAAMASLLASWGITPQAVEAGLTEDNLPDVIKFLDLLDNGYATPETYAALVYDGIIAAAMRCDNLGAEFATDALGIETSFYAQWDEFIYRPAQERRRKGSDNPLPI